MSCPRLPGAEMWNATETKPKLVRFWRALTRISLSTRKVFQKICNIWQLPCNIMYWEIRYLNNFCSQIIKPNSIEIIELFVSKDMIFFVSVACQIKGIGLGRTFSKRNLASDMSFGAYPQSPVLEIRTRVRTLHQSVLKERFTTSLAYILKPNVKRLWWESGCTGHVTWFDQFSLRFFKIIFNINDIQTRVLVCS